MGEHSINIVKHVPTNSTPLVILKATIYIIISELDLTQLASCLNLKNSVMQQSFVRDTISQSIKKRRTGVCRRSKEETMQHPLYLNLYESS